jgi:SP family facilitated glucose transporter-like MFS transporter 12
MTFKLCIFTACEIIVTLFQVGFCDEFSSTLASVGLGFMKVLSTGVSLAVVDGLGRRKALLGGITLMALSVLSLSVFAFYQVKI